MEQNQECILQDIVSQCGPMDHAIGQFNLILIETKYLIRFCWKYLQEIFTKGREMLFDGEKILL